MKLSTKTRNNCPLDGHPTEPHADGLLLCTKCAETLTPGELVTRATPRTRKTYLAGGTTDTRSRDVPWISLRQLVFGLRKKKLQTQNNFAQRLASQGLVRGREQKQ